MMKSTLISIGQNTKTTVIGVAVLALVGVMYWKDPTVDLTKIMAALLGIGSLISKDSDA